MMSAENMGGQGHLSKLNTRIIYTPAAAYYHDVDPTGDSSFDDAQTYFVNHIQNRIIRGEPLATTSLRMDSCTQVICIH